VGEEWDRKFYLYMDLTKIDLFLTREILKWHPTA